MRRRTTRTGAAWRWSRNIPLPEPHLVALVAGLVAGALTGWRAPLPTVVRLLGLCLMAGGVTLVTWATRTASRTRLADPDQLITTGPYALGRNPMYVGWTLVYVGLGLLLANGWLLVLLPAVLAATDVTIRREERRLQDRFGSLYRAYVSNVRRYV